MGGFLLLSVVSAPSPTRQGVTWSMQDMLDHLKSSGIKFTVALSTDTGGFGQGEAMVLLVSNGKQQAGIIQKSSQQAAQDFTRAIPSAYAWGRFAFLAGGEGGAEFLSAVRKSLE